MFLKSGGHAILLQRFEFHLRNAPPSRTPPRPTSPQQTRPPWHRQSIQLQLATKPCKPIFWWYSCQSESKYDKKTALINLLKLSQFENHPHVIHEQFQDTLDSSSHPLTGPGTGSGSHLGSNSGQSGQGSLGSHSSHDVNYMNIYQNTNHPHLYVSSLDFTIFMLCALYVSGANVYALI